MKFSCEKLKLLDAVTAASKAVLSKSASPALEALLFEVSSGVLKITGYNMEIGITVTLEVENCISGTALLSSSLFFEIVRKMPEGNVDIAVDDSLETVILGGSARASFKGIPCDQFPELPKIEGEDAIALSVSDFKRLINTTEYAVAQNTARPILTGFLFEVVGGCINVVAVDGFRLALAKQKVESESEFSVVVPKKTMSEAVRIIKDTAEKVEIAVSKKQIVLEAGGVRIISRLLEGEFMKWRSAIPAESKIKCTADVRELRSAVELASIFITTVYQMPVRLNFVADRIEISVETALGRSDQSVAAKIEGGELLIGFNNRYLLDMLSVCSSDDVIMELNGPTNQLIVRPVGENSDDFLHLVLPVRLLG